MIVTTIQLIIAATILLVVTLVIKLSLDYKRWLNEKYINHKKEWWRWGVMVLGCTPSIVLYTLASDFHWWIAAPVAAGMCAFFIWLFFDAIFNMLRGFGLWYTGTDDEGDAKTDDFLQAMPLIVHILIKTIPLTILIYVYIKSFYGD